MGKLRDMATGYQWEKIPNEVRVSMLEADVEIDRLRLALREIVRMTGKGADAPMAAERWLDRIDETAIAALSPKEDQG